MEKTIIAEIGTEVMTVDYNEKCIIADIYKEGYWLNVIPNENKKSSCSSRSAEISDITGLNGETIFHPNFIGSKKTDKDIYILIPNGTKTHKEISDVFSLISEANKTALDFCLNIGGEGFCKARNCLGGGISAIKFPNGKPNKQWKKHSKVSEVYFPVDNSDVKMKINELPTVSNEQMNKIYGFPSMQYVNNQVFTRPGIENINGDFILDVTAGSIIRINEDARVISKAEYYTLKGE